MQEIRHDGVEMDWEPLDHEKMRARLDSGEVRGFSVLKMGMDELSRRNNSIAAKRNKKKRDKKALSKSRRRK